MTPRRHAVITNQTVRVNGPDPICPHISLLCALSDGSFRLSVWEMKDCKIGFTASARTPVRFSDMIEFGHVSVLGKGEKWFEKYN